MLTFLGGVLWIAFCIFMIVLVIYSGSISFLFIGIINLFIIVGIYIVNIGIKEIVKDVKTSKNGILTYGLVVNLVPSGASINGREILDAEIIIMDEFGMISKFKESVGLSYNKYRIGSFVEVKYFEGDINIISSLRENEIPWDISERLIAEMKKQNEESYITNEQNNDTFSSVYNNTQTKETVIINGVEYIRK